MSIPGIAFAGTAAQAGLVILGQRNGPVPRSIGGIVAQVTVEEQHHDALTITEHPVEQGAAISDHAFKRPAEVIIRAGWSNSPSPKSTGLLALPSNVIASLGQTLAAFGSAPGSIQKTYADLLFLQESRQLLTIVTGKRTYNNMLIQSISTSTDRYSEYSLLVTARCKQLIIVQTQTISVPSRTVMASPEKNAAVENLGTKQVVAEPELTQVPRSNLPTELANTPAAGPANSGLPGGSVVSVGQLRVQQSFGSDINTR